MSQCVPSWDLDDNPTHARLDYEVAELTWENGHLAMHGLGPPRVPAKPISSATAAAAAKYTWEKPRASGTLESIVNQATRDPHRKLSFDAGVGGGGVDELVPWFDHHRAAVSAGAVAISGTMTMDALVPNRTSHVGSCSGAAATTEDEDVTGKRAGVARVAVAPEWSRDQSFTGSATIERESQHVTLDTCDRGFTSTSLGSPENTSHGKPFTKATTTTTDDHDSVCHSRPQRKAGDREEEKKKGARKSSVSTKRSRAAAVHNQSERKRRDKINQRMKTLQKMVPNSSKTDKASMLDEVIEYLKQLQAQVQMMSRMNLAPMMLPMPMQQQLQMSMLAPMGMGMGMGMGVVDMNSIGRHNITGISPVLHPTAFMPMSSWDGSGDRLQVAQPTVMPDPLSTFLACQSQPMTMDAYSRMAAMYQQLHQHPVLLSTSKG